MKKWQDHVEECSVYMRGRIAELEDENNRIRIERSEFATAMDYRDKAAQREIDSLAVMGAEMQDIINTQSAQLEAVKSLPDKCRTAFIKKPNNPFSKGFTAGGEFVLEELEAALEQKDE
jgi:hypothetical protein